MVKMGLLLWLSCTIALHL
uniref:Uncharacterized protein n=1 Tax=Rhizophora mucronata TaxID=61149 RepID=A0A2P2PG07_RHIMU